DPEELVISQEASLTMRERIRKNLSDLECRVLTAYLKGKSYQEMATELHCHVKSIDNALQRVKRKLERNLEGEEEYPRRYPPICDIIRWRGMTPRARPCPQGLR